MSKENVVNKEVRKFGETVSVRGIPKIFKTKDVILKLIWIISVLASTAILCWQLYLLFKKYTSYPVSTVYGEDARGSNTFPDISICSLYPLSLSNNAPFQYDDYYNYMLKKIIIDEEITDSSGALTQEDIFDELSALPFYFANFPKAGATDLPCPNIISECVIYNKDWTKKDGNCSVNLKPYWDANYFTCFTFRLDDKEASSTIGASFVIYFDNSYTNLLKYSPDLTQSKSRGVRASVHPRGTAPDFKRGINAGVGTETTVKITQTRRKRLSEPYSAYDCTDAKFLPNSNSTVDLYNYDACLDVCFQKFVAEKCNCLAIYMRFSEDQIKRYNICGNQSCARRDGGNLTCDDRSINDYTCASFFDYDEAEAFCDSTCLQPCKELIYDTTSSVSPWPHPSYVIDIYRRYVKNCSDPNVKRRFAVYAEASDNFDANNQDSEAIELVGNQTEIQNSFLELNFIIEKSKPFFLVDSPVYSWDTMIGLVGGCLSLWLGITVMTGVELVEFVYFMTTLCCRRNEAKTGNNVVT